MCAREGEGEREGNTLCVSAHLYSKLVFPLHPSPLLPLSISPLISFHPSLPPHLTPLSLHSLSSSVRMDVQDMHLNPNIREREMEGCCRLRETTVRAAHVRGCAAVCLQLGTLWMWVNDTWLLIQCSWSTRDIESELVTE